MSGAEQLLYRLIGERIRNARQQVTPRMSQAQLAEKIGLSRTSIVNIEAGRQHAPLHLLWQIAEALGTETNLLIPNSHEYAARSMSVLDEDIVATIEKETAGDPAARQLVTQFVERVRTSR